MKVVLDSNIFISAFTRSGKPDAVFERIAEELDILFITDDIVSEIEGVLKRAKFDLSDEKVEQRIAMIEKFGKKVVITPKHRATGVCRDPKDDKFLECAHAAGVDYIITGDKDLLVLKEYCGAKIITVNEYLKIINHSH
jgi:putative PIN family toxin of toxin-antitoxin system